MNFIYTDTNTSKEVLNEKYDIINKKIMDVLNEEEISILLNSFDNENLIDLKSYIFNKKKKEKVSEDLYNNIINGEEIDTQLFKIKNIEIYICDYFKEKYKTTPLLLAIRHSYLLSNIQFIKFLFKNKIYFDLNYRNEKNNSIFDLIPFLYKNIEKLNKTTNVYQYLEIYQIKWYLNDFYDNFFKDLDEFNKTNDDGNTIYMNVLLSKNKVYKNYMLKKFLSFTYFKDSSIVKKSINLYQINKNGETLLKLFKNTANFRNENDFFFFNYFYDNENIELSDLIDMDLFKTNKDGKTIITHFIENKKMNKILNFCEKISKTPLKSKLNIADNSGNTPLMYVLRINPEKLYYYRAIILKFTTYLDNLNYVNDKKESAFYLACKNGLTNIAIYIYKNDFKNTDKYPDNEPSSIYYLIQDEFSEKQYKNKELNNELVDEADRLKFNDFLNYGKNKNLFLRKSKEYDIKELLDTYEKDIKKRNKKDGIYQLYYVLQKRIFVFRYQKFFIDNNILVLELFNSIPNLLFPAIKFSKNNKKQIK